MVWNVVVRGGNDYREVMERWTVSDVYDAWLMLALRDALEAD